MGHRAVRAIIASGLCGTALGGASVAGCASSAPSSHPDAGVEAGGSDAGVDASEDAAAGPDADAGGDGRADAAPEAAPDVEDGAGGVTFTIDMRAGPLRQLDSSTVPAPVSPYIYGINAIDPKGNASGLTATKTRWGLVRKGGNSLTAWNWTNNYENLGNQACYRQGPAAGGSGLAGAVTGGADPIAAIQGGGAALLATVSVVDHVAAAVDNDTSGACPASAMCGADSGVSLDGLSTAVNTNDLAFASIDGGSRAFVDNEPSKPGDYCTGTGGCTPSASPVYQDEFVAFVRANYGGTDAPPVFFDLDNEPNYWGGTHPEVWPTSGTVPCDTSTVTYDDIVSRDLTYAAAVKKAWPAAKVFGPVVAQDGILYAHSYATDTHAGVEFVDYYLGQLASASGDAGTPLLDVLDVHYYNAATTDPAQCVQNPRMFWDTQYTELSASATDGIDFGWSGVNGYIDSAWYPRAIVPRLQDKIARAYPEGGPGLSFSEYNSGCETTIAGGVAEADDLGVLGREGVFAAAAMPLAALSDNYLVAAFDLYRNYDGNGAVVGDTSVRAVTSDVRNSSVYAFAHSGDASQVEVVAINKSATASPVSISIANAPSLKTSSVFVLATGHAGVVPASSAPPAVQCSDGTCALTYAMPPTSATTIILR